MKATFVFSISCTFAVLANAHRYFCTRTSQCNENYCCVGIVSFFTFFGTCQKFGDSGAKCLIKEKYSRDKNFANFCPCNKHLECESDSIFNWRNTRCRLPPKPETTAASKRNDPVTTKIPKVILETSPAISQNSSFSFDKSQEHTTVPITSEKSLSLVSIDESSRLPSEISANETNLNPELFSTVRDFWETEVYTTLLNFQSGNQSQLINDTQEIESPVTEVLTKILFTNKMNSSEQFFEATDNISDQSVSEESNNTPSDNSNNNDKLSSSNRKKSSNGTKSNGRKSRRVVVPQNVSFGALSSTSVDTSSLSTVSGELLQGNSSTSFNNSQAANISMESDNPQTKEQPSLADTTGPTEIRSSSDNSNNNDKLSSSNRKKSSNRTRSNRRKSRRLVVPQNVSFGATSSTSVDTSSLSTVSGELLQGNSSTSFNNSQAENISVESDDPQTKEQPSLTDTTWPTEIRSSSSKVSQQSSSVLSAEEIQNISNEIP